MKLHSCWMLAGLLVLLSLAVVDSPARAEGWRSAQPQPSPPNSEQSVIRVPVPLGHIGDIEFWAPNRGLLITAGNEATPAGLYYYNGVAWRELSTVCGGSEGRIAWAGPDNFWTISDQQAGQQLGSGSEGGQNRSLCHFENGRVVASYAEPIGVPGSYQPMDAAACSGPNNCWFGGERLPTGANGGAFHLHWNGTVLTPVPSLETAEPHLEDPAHSVTGIVFYKGHFYESVQIQSGDPTGAGESASQPFLLHKIVEGSGNPFVPLIPEGPLREGVAGVGGREPFTYAGAGAFRFSGDSNALWAMSGVGSAALLMLGSNGQFQQIKLSEETGLGGITGIAAEPGTEDAWVSTGESVFRIQSDGVVDANDHLPEPGEQLGDKGATGPIACPARGDCWVATSQGWLFHLGGEYPEDKDPNFQSVIGYRPPDASIPFVAPESFPEDDSGANPPALLALKPPSVTNSDVSKVPAPLFTQVKEKLVDRTTLAITFTLVTKSHVRVLALRRKHTIAQTRPYVLGRGRHTLKLRLNPSAWPTKLDLRVKAIGHVPLIAPGTGSGEAVGGPTAVSTSLHRGRSGR